jgi:hypothetical protein
MSYASAPSGLGAEALLYRSVNERIAELNVGLDALGSLKGQWICECADAGCMTPVSATVEEYEAVRANARTFIVVPGHVDPDTECVVRVDDGFAVVEKLGAAGEAAELGNPRAREAGGRSPVFA